MVHGVYAVYVVSVDSNAKEPNKQKKKKLLAVAGDTQLHTST